MLIAVYSIELQQTYVYRTIESNWHKPKNRLVVRIQANNNNKQNDRYYIGSRLG